MIHVSGNKLAIDKNEVEWSFPEENLGTQSKVVASEESTYQRPTCSGYMTLIGLDVSGKTLVFNEGACYGDGGQSDLIGTPTNFIGNVAGAWLFYTSGGYAIGIGGPPDLYIVKKDPNTDWNTAYPSSTDSLFMLATYYGWRNGLVLEATTPQSEYAPNGLSFTFPEDAGIILGVPMATPGSAYSEQLDQCFQALFPEDSFIFTEQKSTAYDQSIDVLTTSQLAPSTTYNSTYTYLSKASGGRLYVGLPSCPSAYTYATDSSYYTKLISHYYSTSTISNINTTYYLANAEYGLTVSSSTTNLPISVTSTTRIHLKNKNFYSYNKSTSYPYIVQELTYLNSTNKGRKFERVINYKSSTASSCEWGTWYETTADKLVLTDSSQTITGNKNFLGVNNFGTSTSFQYGGIGNGTADANRHVWFNDDSAVGRPVKNDNFKYNPATQQLQIGASNNASVQLSECTLQYNSSSKSLSFNFN